MFNLNHLQHKKLNHKVWLSSPTMHGEELRFMTEAYQTNWMSTVGSNITEIEEQLSKMLGCRYAVALSSGTAALHMAVKLAKVSRNEKVFCSDLTFGATVNPILYEGGIPILIDSEYDTWNMDPVALKRAFSLYPEVRVVIVAHLYGTPAKIDEIRAICNEHNAILIEDAAESLGATYKQKQTGTYGSYGVISFNGNKIITGSAGGMLFTSCLSDSQKAKKWSTQAKENAPWYQHEEVGYNYRMSNVIAGVVRGQIPYLQEHIAKKRAIYERYEEGFQGIPVKMNPYDKKNSVPNYWLSCMTVNPVAMCKQMREEQKAVYIKESKKSCPTEILEALASINAEGRPIWKPMHKQPVYASYPLITREDDNKQRVNSVSMDIFERGLCLPSDIKMTIKEQDMIIQVVRDCFQ